MARGCLARACVAPVGVTGLGPGITPGLPRARPRANPLRLRDVPACSSDLTAGGAVAIVTGGSSGAGRRVVEALAGRGYAVVVVYLSDQSRADAVVDDILARGGAAITVRADVGDNLDVERMFDESSAAFGGVDVVVHAAPGAAAVVVEHAERRLRWGGILIVVSCADDVADAMSCIDSWSSTTGG